MGSGMKWMHRYGLISTMALALVAGTARAEAPPTECDELAAHPADPHKVTAGVQWDIMKGHEAVRACEQAIVLYPDSLRIRYELGRALLRVERRDDALPHLIDAAEKGYLIAFSNIGGMYQFDLRNYAEALKWFQRGVAAGDESSRIHLAEMYVDGTGVPQNFSTALGLYMPSAEKNSAVSLYKIGLIYTRGDHTVPRDYTKALQYFQRAAGLGFARAQNDIGWALEQGHGLQRNPAEAAKWYRVAAGQGYGLAQLNMGRLSENGVGVPRDLKEAFYWYRLATDSRVAQEKQTARQKVEQLRKRIEPSALAEVDGRINKWRVLKPEETVAMLPSPVDPNYVPPSQVAAVDTRYAPPPAPSGKAAPSGAAGVDKSYVPPPDPPRQAAAKAPASQAPSGKSEVDTSYTPPPVIELQAMDARYAAAKKANVRTMPDANAPLVATLDPGREVAVTGKVIGQNWLAIDLDGKRGYVLGSLLTAKPEKPAEPQKKEPAPGAVASAAPAGQTPAPAKDDIWAMLSGIEFGRYHALVIGNAAYRHIDKLVSPKNDARAIAALLSKDFGFKTTVLNDATRADIIAAFARLRATLTEKDNLLVYYAGHGIVDDATQRGYWLPVDAEREVPTNWISTADITDMVRAISAKHVMIVADACYSGTLMRNVTARMETAREKAAWLRRIAAKRARTVLSSGGLEPVLDSGGGEHSVFAKAFLDALKEGGEVIDALSLYDALRRPVIVNSDQTPQYADIRNAGHDGGDFIFLRARK